MKYEVTVVIKETYIVDAESQDDAQEIAAKRMWEEHNASGCDFIGCPELIIE